VQGWRSLKKTLDLIPDDVIKIADAKRGDVPHSAEKYRDAFFKELPFDAVTLNPLLGYDAVAPFLEDETRGVFLLCLTSNEGAADFQFFSDGKRALFERIAEKAVAWNKNGNVGLVVGATKADYLERVRAIAPDLPILIPGVGAQGGDLRASVQAAQDASGGGFLVNSSRGILYDADNFEFAQTARKKAETLRDAINKARKRG
jgi:orotidine-5'-phosphate decarboxylase